VSEIEKENKHREKKVFLSDFYFFFFFNWVRCIPPRPPAEGGGYYQLRLMPDDLSVRAAIEANDKFIQALEHIRDSAQRQLEHA
jgi:hypothetical protein